MPLIKSSFAKARRIALALYKSRLDPRFVYHDRRHALDVVRAARRLADRARAAPRDRVLLETAALFHDLGFIFDRDDHENASAELCRRILPECAFSSEEIECIAAMIQATRWPQNPKSPLEALLCDADLDCLGRRDFMKVSKKLRDENASFGIRRTDEQWLQDEIEFLRNHRFHTPVARQLRGHGKQVNLAALTKLLNKRPR